MPENRTIFLTGPEAQIEQIRAFAGLGGLNVYDVSFLMPPAKDVGPYDHLPPDERKLQEDLDKDFAYALVPTVMGNCQSIEKRLRRSGITTMRDVLSLGHVGLANHGVAHVSAEQRDKLAQATKLTYPGLALLEQPTPADIARFCLSLDQVHGGVLPGYGTYLKERQYKIGAESWQKTTANRIIRNEISFSKAGLRVGEILTNTRVERPDVELDFIPSDVFSPDALKECQEQARVFAVEFELARQQMGRDPA